MRKLAKILKAVPLFDFKGEILKDNKLMTIPCDVTKHTRVYSPYHGVTSSHDTDVVRFQLDRLFWVRTSLNTARDFDGAAERERPECGSEQQT